MHYFFRLLALTSLVGACFGAKAANSNPAEFTPDPVETKILLRAVHNCERIRENLTKPELLAKDQYGRPQMYRLNGGFDFVLEYADASSRMPSAIVGMGRRLQFDGPKNGGASLAALKARLTLFKKIKSICRIDQIENGQDKESRAFTSGDGYESWYNIEDGFTDSSFWADTWTPDYWNITDFYFQTFQQEKTPRERCLEECNKQVDMVSDGINIICGAVGMELPPAGLACLVGSFVGKYRGKAICDTNCGR